MALVGQKAVRGWASVRKCRGFRDVRMVSAAEGGRHRPPATICQGMDFGGCATTRVADRLNFRPPFPPCAERCARTAVATMLRSPGNAAGADRVAKMRPQRPRWRHRLKRLQIVVGGPQAGGRSCRRHPTRRTRMIPLITRRSSTRRAPGWFVGKCGLIAARARSESQNPADIARLPRSTARRESDDEQQISRLIGYRPRGMRSGVGRRLHRRRIAGCGRGWLNMDFQVPPTVSRCFEAALCGRTRLHGLQNVRRSLRS